MSSSVAGPSRLYSSFDSQTASDPNRTEPLPWGRLLRTRIQPSTSRPRHIQLVDFLLGYAHDQDNHGVRPIFGNTRRSGRIMARLAGAKNRDSIATSLSGENLRAERVRSKMKRCEGALVARPILSSPLPKLKATMPRRRSRKRTRSNPCVPAIEAPSFSDVHVQHNSC